MIRAFIIVDGSPDTGIPASAKPLGEWLDLAAEGAQEYLDSKRTPARTQHYANAEMMAQVIKELRALWPFAADEGNLKPMLTFDQYAVVARGIRRLTEMALDNGDYRKYMDARNRVINFAVMCNG